MTYRRCWVLTYLIWHGWGLIRFDIICLVVEPPLWNIWVRQLGWWHSQYMEKMEQKHVPNHQPVMGFTMFHMMELGDLSWWVSSFAKRSWSCQVATTNKVSIFTIHQLVNWHPGLMGIDMSQVIFCAPITAWFILPSGYLTVRHGKIHHF